MPQPLSKSRCLARLRDELLGSRLIENSLRGYLCEVMVAEAIGPSCRIVSGGWHPWDLELGTPGQADFIRIQVKNSAALQSWHTVSCRPSDCSFNLSYRPRPAYFEQDFPDVPCEPHGFLCDLYALCHHPVVDHALADHADPGQWQVYLVPTDPACGAITSAEIDCAQKKVPQSAVMMRRPGTLDAGIRGRAPVRPTPLEELSEEVIRSAILQP